MSLLAVTLFFSALSCPQILYLLGFSSLEDFHLLRITEDLVNGFPRKVLVFASLIFTFKEGYLFLLIHVEDLLLLISKL